MLFFPPVKSPAVVNQQEDTSVWLSHYDAGVYLVPRIKVGFGILNHRILTQIQNLWSTQAAQQEHGGGAPVPCAADRGVETKPGERQKRRPQVTEGASLHLRRDSCVSSQVQADAKWRAERKGKIQREAELR